MHTKKGFVYKFTRVLAYQTKIINRRVGVFVALIGTAGCAVVRASESSADRQVRFLCLSLCLNYYSC